MKLVKKFFLALTALSFLTSQGFAATTKYMLTGKVKDGSGYKILLVQKNGTTTEASLPTSGAFKFKKLTLAQLKGASLQLVDGNGRYAGPVVLGKKADKVSTTFSGKALDGTTIALGQIELMGGYAKVKKSLKAKLFSKPNVVATDGEPIGANNLGLGAPSTSSLRVSSKLIRAKAESTPSPGADPDSDGIPSAIDADDDGDGILDASDPDSVGLDIPMTSLYFDFRRTLNAHVRTGLTDEAVDGAISGENAFALSIFFSLPSDSTIDGGYVVCDDSLVYCRKDTPTAYYGGLSESTTEFRDHFWSELLNSDGYPRMEKIRVGGTFDAIVASIQPRVGPDQFRPGDIYRAVLTNGSTVVSSRTLALAPYFVSIPAIKEYNAGSGTVSVDYNAVDANSGSIPGASPGDPIVLSSDGNLTLTFWRPQRAAIRSDETGYYDWGNLHYGVIIEDAQATCAGYYSGVSSDLQVDSDPLGDGGSPLASSGANMNPYTDLQGDRAANSANTLTFTVNLKDCLGRVGLTANTYRVNLSSAGEDVTGGRISSNQNLYVQIP